jgi:hypothetical protein
MKTKTKRIKARRMWAVEDGKMFLQCCTKTWIDEKNIPVAVLNVSDEAALIEQAKDAIRNQPCPFDIHAARAE